MISIFRRILAAIAVFIVCVSFSSPAGDTFAATGSMDAPVLGVISSSGEGYAGTIHIEKLSGLAGIIMDNSTEIGNETLYSAYAALSAAELVSNTTGSGFRLSYRLDSDRVNGRSGSASVAVSMLALISGRKAREDAVATGEIDFSGNILPVENVLAKIRAAGDSGFRYMVVPEANSFENAYVRHVQESPFEQGISPYSVYYTLEKVNVSEYAERRGITVVSVKNLAEAASFLLE